MDQTLQQAETLIIGSNGFIGRNLLALLSDLGMSVVRGIRTPGGSHDGFKLDRGRDAFVDYPEIRRIIYAGIPNIEFESDIKSIMEMHTDDVLNFADEARKQNKKMYFYWTGSYWQDQERFDYYTMAKRRIEKKLHLMASENFRVISLHLGDTYGPQDVRKKLIPEIIESINDNKVLHVKNSRNLVTPIHINDIKTAFTTLLSLEKSDSLSVFQVFDLIGINVKSVQEILNTVALLDSRFEYQKYQQDGDIFPINSVHMTIPGWSPTIDLIEGLNELLSGKEASRF